MHNNDVDVSRMLEYYRDLIRRFSSGEITADSFEIDYLALFKNDSNQVTGRAFDILDELFANVDAYVGDATLREATGGIGGEELRECARNVYTRLYDGPGVDAVEADYTHLPGLVGVYLEDSFVLGISDRLGQFTFALDAVLTPEHPAYHRPLPGEQNCYAAGTLVFYDVTRVEWIKKNQRNYTDASGEQDLGNIDTLRVDGDAFVAEGDWGEVRVFGTTPRFELGP